MGLECPLGESFVRRLRRRAATYALAEISKTQSENNRTSKVQKKTIPSVSMKALEIKGDTLTPVKEMRRKSN